MGYTPLSQDELDTKIWWRDGRTTPYHNTSCQRQIIQKTCFYISFELFIHSIFYTSWRL